MPSIASRKTLQDPGGMSLNTIPQPCQRSRMVPLHSLTSAAICNSGSVGSECAADSPVDRFARTGLLSSTCDSAGTSEETGFKVAPMQLCYSRMNRNQHSVTVDHSLP